MIILMIITTIIMINKAIDKETTLTMLRSGCSSSKTHKTNIDNVKQTTANQPV